MNRPLKAKQLREQGVSFEKIAKQLGSSSRTVRRWLSPSVVEAEKLRGKLVYAAKGSRWNKHLHDKVTYFIGSPLFDDRVMVGSTNNLPCRKSNYKKTLCPLYLIGTTAIPEREVLERFRESSIAGHSREVLWLTDDLKKFIADNCSGGESCCFVGSVNDKL